MIKFYLFLHPETITPKQLQEEMLPRLPSWRKQQTLKYRHHMDQVLCAQSFLLLQAGLARDFNVQGEIVFDYLENNKPILKDYPHINFNISHCKQGVLCVISDVGPVGCDIESLDRKISKPLLLRCCSAQEIEQIQQAPCPNEAFIRLWTIKEAVLKYTGTGLVDDLQNLLTPSLLSTIELETHTQKSVSFTICKKKTTEVSLPSL